MTFVLGGHQTDFARNIAREGTTLTELVGEIVTGTLATANIDVDQIESIHVGNAFGQLYTGQGHLGAMPATAVPELAGVPAMRHEAACASASLAVLAATAEIEAGRYDVVLVLGVEQERTMPGLEASQVQAAAAYVPEETGPDGIFGDLPIWPAAFDRIAEEYDNRFGLDDRHLRAIAELNFTNAQANPLAQTRDWNLTPEMFAADDHANPVVAGRLRRSDCTHITDGGAGVVLVSDRWMAEHRPDAGEARLAGWGHRTVGLPLEQKIRASRDDEYVMPHVRRAITDAWRRAGIVDVDAVDAIETHDCMTASEYLAIDHFGITKPGASWQAIDDGAVARDGTTPVNASGGLLGGGHPVGSTGVRMLVDCAKQVRGTAGGYQVEGVRTAQTLNIGGSTATTVSLVVQHTTVDAV